MLFGIDKSEFFGDTPIPDVFITEYLPSLTPIQVKLYVYVYYLSQRGLRIEKKDVCAKIGIDGQALAENLLEMEALGMLESKGKMIKLADLKEKQLLKFYAPKFVNDPEQAVANNTKNVKRIEVVKSINNKFFQGAMSPSWYLDIDTWLDRYSFEEDVLSMLFQYCFERNAMNRNYIAKVAEGWYKEGVRTCDDVDAYFMAYENRKTIRKKIASKLNIYSPFSEYEDAYIKTWIEDYKFGFDVIELALKGTTKKLNVGFDYINAILRSWYEKGLKTADDVMMYEKTMKEKRLAEKRSAKDGAAARRDIESAKDEAVAGRDIDWDSLYEK